MRLAKFILNLIQLIFVYFLISLTTLGVYSAVVFQADDESARLTMTNEEERVWALDNFSYWIDDISVNVKNTEMPNPKLRIALWFNWNWWRESMSKVDAYVVNPAVAVVKPLIAPISCADEIKKYYGKDISDFSDYIKTNSDTYTDLILFINKRYNITETENIIEFLLQHKDEFTLDALAGTDNATTDISKFAHDYNHLYQLVYTIDKYNQPEYGKWYNKFVIETGDNNRILSTSVYALYSLNYINIILAIAYCWCNKIDVDRSSDGTIIPDHGFHRHKRNKKRNKHKKEDAE